MSNAIGFDMRHRWVIRGQTKNSEPVLMTWTPGICVGVNTLAEAEEKARSTAGLYNRNGGSVHCIKQHLDINELWQDC